MKNFYFKTEGTNNESVEVYVGQSSGKQLNNDILNAEKEVLIVSPYIDESKIDDLIKLKNRGVNIRVAFSDLRDGQKANILRKLIHQQKDIDEQLREKVNKKKNQYSILSNISLVLGIFLFLYTGFNLNVTSLSSLLVPMAGVIGILGFYKFNQRKKKVEKTPIFSYEYTEKMNFKYLRNNFQSLDKMFIHSKIYIIDRKFAYVGSLNYTKNGFTTNFETRVRITQSTKINELVEFVHDIFDDNYNFKAHELWFLGKQVYSEELY